MFAGKYAPAGWATCDGQLVPIESNPALFSLLDTIYGGDGISTFALPLLNGRTPVQQGQGPGLSPYQLADVRGTLTTNLDTENVPAHTHPMNGDAAEGAATDPSNAVFASAKRGKDSLYSKQSTNVQEMSPSMISPFGAGWSGTPQSVDIVQPYINLTFIIALQGVFPPRPPVEDSES
jgi:microcystin-dependent protein